MSQVLIKNHQHCHKRVEFHKVVCRKKTLSQSCLHTLFYRWNRIELDVVSQGTFVGSYSLQRSPVPIFSAQSIDTADDLAKHSAKSHVSGVFPSSETSGSPKSQFNSANFSCWKGSSFKNMTGSRHVYGPIATPVAIDNMLDEVDTKVEVQRKKDSGCTGTDENNLEHHSSNISQEGTSFSGVEFYTDDSFVDLSAENSCSQTTSYTINSPIYSFDCS